LVKTLDSDTIPAMPFVAWSPKLELGVASIDSQHRNLVEILDRLHASAAAGRCAPDAIERMDELVTHVVRHYAHEESLMVEHGYMDGGAHRLQHESFKAQAAGLVARMKGGEDVLTPDTLEYLREWLTNHVTGPDRRMSGFLVSHGATV
jgi:hemerythrin-like metal-binding protein